MRTCPPIGQASSTSRAEKVTQNSLERWLSPLVKALAKDTCKCLDSTCKTYPKVYFPECISTPQVQPLPTNQQPPVQPNSQPISRVQCTGSLKASTASPALFITHRKDCLDASKQKAFGCEFHKGQSLGSGGEEGQSVMGRTTQENWKDEILNCCTNKAIWTVYTGHGGSGASHGKPKNRAAWEER